MSTKKSKPITRLELKSIYPHREATTKGWKLQNTKYSSLFPAKCQSIFNPSIAALLLCLLIVVFYLPSLQAGFVWDDTVFVNAKPVHSLSGLWQIWFEPDSLKGEVHYWPVLYTIFWLEHKLWGLAPVGYHIVNLLLHSAVTLLLWRLLLRLRLPGAWFVAAIFAVHPLHVESVAWVIGRKDILATLFYLSSALAYIRFVEGKHFRYYLWALLLLVLGMLSKSVIVTLPLALLIWHWWRQGRITLNDVMKVLPFLLIALSISFADWSYYKSLESISFDHSLIERILTATRVLWFYVIKLILPVDLAVIYPLWDVNVNDPLGWIYLMTTVLLVVLLWYFRNRIGRGHLAGILFFVVTLSPVLGFIDYGFMEFSFVADRYQYLAGTGIIAILVGVVACWLRKLLENNQNKSPSPLYKLVPALMGIILLILGTLTWQQASIYRNPITFYEHIISLNPQARSAHYSLSHHLEVAGRKEEALVAARISQKKLPHLVRPYIGLGSILVSMGQLEEAEQHFQTALRLKPGTHLVLEHLGSLRIKQKRYQEALELFRSIIKNDSKYENAYFGIGVALSNLNRLEEALDNYNLALSLNPSLKDALVNRKKTLVSIEHLGSLRIKQKRYQEAIELFRSIIKTNSKYSNAYVGIGVALANLNRLEEALDNFNLALSLNPNSKGALANRERVLKNIRNKSK